MTRQYMGHNAKRKLRWAESSPDRLCSGTSITLMTTGGSRICSHQ